MEQSSEEYLTKHGVRLTAVRLLVWNEIKKNSEAFSLADIEAAMPQMDRSSIFRSLRLFAQHQLIHEINDGLGITKYCLCRCNDEHHHHGHIHFTCIHCGKTFCFEDQPIPPAVLPHGFEMAEAEYVIKGTCPECRK